MKEKDHSDIVIEEVEELLKTSVEPTKDEHEKFMGNFKLYRRNVFVQNWAYVVSTIIVILIYGILGYLLVTLRGNSIRTLILYLVGAFIFGYVHYLSNIIPKDRIFAIPQSVIDMQYKLVNVTIAETGVFNDINYVRFYIKDNLSELRVPVVKSGYNIGDKVSLIISETINDNKVKNYFISLDDF